MNIFHREGENLILIHKAQKKCRIPSKPVLISAQGGTITISGLAAGTATDGTATLATNLEAGSIDIVKMGDYSIKVAIK